MEARVMALFYWRTCTTPSNRHQNLLVSNLRGPAHTLGTSIDSPGDGQGTEKSLLRRSKGRIAGPRVLSSSELPEMRMVIFTETVTYSDPTDLPPPRIARLNDIH